MRAHQINPQLRARLAGLRLLALDVDGVLTDGSLYFTANGDEMKAFNILDGLGLKLVRDAGVEVAIITGRNSPLTKRRADDLKIKHLIQGREDKQVALQALLEELGISPEQAAYVGDDLPDLSAIRYAGAGMTVANGHWMVKQHADYCTRLAGGQGAVREICDLICDCKGLIDKVTAPFKGQQP